MNAPLEQQGAATAAAAAGGGEREETAGGATDTASARSDDSADGKKIFEVPSLHEGNESRSSATNEHHTPQTLSDTWDLSRCYDRRNCNC